MTQLPYGSPAPTAFNARLRALAERHCKRLAALLAIWLGLTTLAAAQAPIDVPAGTYTLEKTHASLTWRILHMGLSNYTARFTRFDATLRFDPQDFSRSTVEASVDLASVETDYIPVGGRDFNQDLRSADFFNVVQSS